MSTKQVPSPPLIRLEVNKNNAACHVSEKILNPEDFLMSENSVTSDSPHVSMNLHSRLLPKTA